MHIVEILDIISLTHDVKKITTEKPKGYTFIPGQATEVAIQKENWKGEKRPFTFTLLPEDNHLEFIIKIYRDHNGVTDQMDDLMVGDELSIGDAWGAIQFKENGVFIAGGAGITPFISIFRDLESKNKLTGNKLFFANKTGQDVIMESYWQEILGDSFYSVLAEENLTGHFHGLINMDFLKNQIEDFSQSFYICGPEKMVEDISKSLEFLGADPEGVVFEN